MSKQIGISTSKGYHQTDGTGFDFIIDQNGVLKIGDVIIPQKKLLWTGNQVANTDSWTPTYIDLSSFKLTRNTILEAEIRVMTASEGSIFVKFRANNDYVNQSGTMVFSGQLYGSSDGYSADIRGVAFGCDVDPNTQLVTRVGFLPSAKSTATTNPVSKTVILNIWQVIE